HGRVLNDLLRYTQVCRARGELVLDGAREAGDWHACRDHSWGIRSTMGPPTPAGGVEPPERDPRALRLWVPFECGGDVGFFHTHEDASGATLDFEGRLHRGCEAVELAGVRHRLVYEEGSTRLAAGELTLLDARGREHAYRIRVACPPAHPQGFGYARGWSDGGQPGVYRGAEVVERSRFRVDDPRDDLGAPHLPPGRRLGGTEYASTIESAAGETGMAHVESMLYGGYRPAPD